MNPSAQQDIRLYIKWAILVFAAITTGYFAKAQKDPLYYTPGEDLSKKTANYLFLKVETNKKEALVGESISAWYYLYVAVDIQGKLTKSPSFTGFASYDMVGGNADAYEVEKINGIPFRIYLVKQVQLFGLRPGVQRLEPVELEASIRYRKIPANNQEYLNNSGAPDTVIQYTLKSTPVEINIKKLPAITTGSFSGAVGDFNLKAFASTNKVPAGKADTINVVLEGAGNWHEIASPTIQWPDGTEVFEPFDSESLDRYRLPVQGLRTIAYPVVFNKKGNYQVAPVAFTFFNPAIGQYKTVYTDTLKITVTEAQDQAEVTFPKKQSDLTALFSKYAIVIFPIGAVTLLGLLFFRRRKL